MAVRPERPEGSLGFLLFPLGENTSLHMSLEGCAGCGVRRSEEGEDGEWGSEGE